MIEAQNVPNADARALGQIRPQSLIERLEDEKKRLEDRLVEIENVLIGLQETPETQHILDAVERLGLLNY